MTAETQARGHGVAWVLALATASVILLRPGEPLTYWTIDNISYARPLVDVLAEGRSPLAVLVGSHPPGAGLLVAWFWGHAATLDLVLTIPRVELAVASALLVAFATRRLGLLSGLSLAALLLTDPLLRFYGSIPDNYPLWALAAVVALVVASGRRRPWLDAALGLGVVVLCVQSHVLAMSALAVVVLAAVTQGRRGLLAGAGVGLVLMLPTLAALITRARGPAAYTSSGLEEGAVLGFLRLGAEKGLLGADTVTLIVAAAFTLSMGWAPRLAALWQRGRASSSPTHAPDPAPVAVARSTAIAVWIVVVHLGMFIIAAAVGAASLHQHPYLLAAMPLVSFVAVGGAAARHGALAWVGLIFVVATLGLRPQRPEPRATADHPPADLDRVRMAPPPGAIRVVLVEHHHDNDDPRAQEPVLAAFDPDVLRLEPEGHVARRGRCLNDGVVTWCFEGVRPGVEPGAVPEVLREAVAERGAVLLWWTGTGDLRPRLELWVPELRIEGNDEFFVLRPSDG